MPLIASVTLLAVLAMPAGLAAQNNTDSSRNQVRYSLKTLDTLGGTFGEAFGIKQGLCRWRLQSAR